MQRLKGSAAWKIDRGFKTREEKEAVDSASLLLRYLKMDDISSITKKLIIICMDAVGCMSCPIEYNSDDCKNASAKIKELRKTAAGNRYLDQIKY